MTKLSCTEEQFLEYTAKHEMTVLQDQGLYRHLRFKRPDSGTYWFDLITWPGILCINGDMGTYVFSRLEDMFEFFRTSINPGYWSEKLQAPTPRGAKKFDADSFRQQVKETFDDWVKNNEPDKEYSTQEEREDFEKQKSDLLSDIEDTVLSIADDGEIRAYDAAREFSSTAADNFNMNDCWDWNCREYTFGFLWCCYAISFGIQMYDDYKAETNEDQDK